MLMSSGIADCDLGHGLMLLSTNFGNGEETVVEGLGDRASIGGNAEHGDLCWWHAISPQLLCSPGCHSICLCESRGGGWRPELRSRCGKSMSL